MWLHHALFPMHASLHRSSSTGSFPSIVQLCQPSGGPRRGSAGGSIERSQEPFLLLLLGEVASGCALPLQTLLLLKWPTLHASLCPGFQISMHLIFNTAFFSHFLQYSNGGHTLLLFFCLLAQHSLCGPLIGSVKQSKTSQFTALLR